MNCALLPVLYLLLEGYLIVMLSLPDGDTSHATRGPDLSAVLREGGVASQYHMFRDGIHSIHRQGWMPTVGVKYLENIPSTELHA
jgi:hypothetical protein